MEGPFHSGEIEVQRRAGVRAAAERVGRIIAPGLPADAGRRLLAHHRFAVATTVDVEGWPRATLLTGPAGFLEPVADDLVRIAAPLPSGAPLAGGLARRPELGLLAFDPTRRQRLRLNGRAHRGPEGLFLLVDQAYGNCTKYIQRRRLVAEERSGAAGQLHVGRELSGRQRARIERADTFFLATFHPSAGADASHRGGRPGFVRATAADRLSFADYPGNAMFNTLGNLVAYPRLALLFVDFATGDLLEIAGDAQVGAELDVEVRVAAVREYPGAMPFRYELVEYSPVLPPPSRFPAAGISRSAGTPTQSGDPT